MSSDQPAVAPYGAWSSPISAASLTADRVSLSAIAVDGDDVYWLEGRAAEGGRQVLVRRAADGSMSDVTALPFNVRTRVHEYGGGAYAVHRGTVVFSNFADGRLYRVGPGDAQPTPITADLPGSVLRFGDLHVHPSGAYLVAVREDHRGDGEAVNTLVRLDLPGVDQTGQVLVAGHDFVSSPRISPDGRTLAFLSWEHPDMPWDSTVLWTARLSEHGEITDRRPVAGQDERESLTQPGWLTDGRLVVISDRSEWWNLYLVDRASGRLTAVHPADAEFAEPAWTFGGSDWTELADGRIAVRWKSRTGSGLGVVRPDTGELIENQVDGTEFDSLAAFGDGLVCLIGSAARSTAVVRLDGDRVTVLRASAATDPDPAYLSRPRAIRWPTPDGTEAYGLLYLPTNPDFVAPEGGLPPLLVCSHGGPTGRAWTGFNLGYQFWTSRGFAVLDVDYGGSTGYGRPYRNRLRDSWGVVDVDDCCSGAQYLAAQGVVDGSRLAIRGGSAGGYTTLAALAFRDTFAVGASHFGVADPEMLARDTHKFESRYLDRLIGPYPEAAAVYADRSPLRHTEGLNCPIILFQGSDDRVVPPNQAHAMADALRAKGLPVALLEFAGEGHGFRKAETIIRVQEAELSFYGQIFGFAPADPIEPVPIENLPQP